MRLLATLPDSKQAHTLADHLLTLGIDTRVESEARGGGWELWVCDEDRVPQARQELETFLRDPQDARYTQAVRTARAVRAQQEQEEEAFQTRQEDFEERMEEGPRPPLPRLSLLVMGFCLAVALATNLGS